MEANLNFFYNFWTRLHFIQIEFFFLEVHCVIYWNQIRKTNFYDIGTLTLSLPRTIKDPANLGLEGGKFFVAGFTEASFTLICFQRKRSCFAPFRKRFASTLIVFVSFSPVHTTTPYPFWNAVIPSVHMLKWTRRMRISIYRPAKLARNWSHMVASIRHFGYSRSSGLAPRRVYFDDVTVFR